MHKLIAQYARSLFQSWWPKPQVCQRPSTNQGKVLTSLDSYRDGGSISVSYACDEVESLLFFRLDYQHERTRDKEVDCRKFTCAELKECHRFQWTNKVGEVMDDYLASTLPVSWETAIAILRELSPQLKWFGLRNIEIFDQMMRVALNEGAELPYR